MAATEDSADNSLWDASVCRKSWADMVEEEEAEEKCSSKGRNPHVEENSKDDHPLRKSRDWRNSKSLGFRSSARLSKNMATTSILEEPIHDEEANLGNVDEETKIPKVESLPTFGRNLGKNQPRTPVKQQPQLPQEDISLTGHLDVKLGLVSPAKMGTDRLTSVRSSVPRASPSKGSKRKAENGLSTDDQMLMPSPSKILRSTPKKEELLVKKEETATAMASPAALLTRKRVRDLLTPTSSSKSAKRREKRDPETDPDVLARRQKQIDFGKNTLGYEHYRQMVPKPEREKNHPKTPPIGIKFSRRAWDGLVRVWRQRLHFWDPPEDGGGNPACLEIQSDASDCYSTDGSLPNTPVQEVKRKRAERSMRFSSRRSEVSEPDEDDGCTPLPD